MIRSFGVALLLLGAMGAVTRVQTSQATTVTRDFDGNSPTTNEVMLDNSGSNTPSAKTGLPEESVQAPAIERKPTE